LNSLHTVAEIQTFLVEEATELIGGERVLLILEKEGLRTVTEFILPLPSYQSGKGYATPEDPHKVLASIDPHLDRAGLTRIVQLILPEGSGLNRLIAPLIAQNKLLGYLYVDMDPLYGMFNETDRDMLGMLANQAAVALDNAQWTEGLENKVKERTEELNARLDELAILNSVGEAMAKTLDVKTVTRIVGDKVRDIFRTDGVSILLLDAQAGMIHTLYEYDSGEGGYIDFIEPFPLGQGLTTRVIRSRQPLLIGTSQEQVALGAYMAPELLEKGIGGVPAESMMFVPIIVGEKVIGVTSVSNYKPNFFNEDHLRLLQTLASNMGVAIQNARLFEAEQERVAELAVINSVQAGLAAQLDMQAIYDLVGDKIREIFDAQVVLIDTFDLEVGIANNRYLRERGVRYYPEPRPPFLLHEHIASTRQPLLINQDAGRRTAELGLPVADGTEVPKSALFVPLIRGDMVKGMLSLQNIDHENAFSESDVRLLTTLANSMSVALENARLFNETEQRNSELSVINSVQQGLAAELDFQAIVDLVGDKLRQVFNMPDLYINWIDDKNNQVTFLYAYEHGERLTLNGLPILPDSIIGRLVKTRQPIVWNTMQEGDRLSPAIPGTDPSRSGVAVPIISSDHVLGAIQLENYEREYAFGEPELRLLTTIAGSLGSSLESAHLFDETQRLLKETDQRAKELAVINSIQQGLAAQLDIQAIYDLVGDKIREVFDAQAVSIVTGDISSGIGYTRYMIEKGQRFYPEPAPFGNLTKHLIQTQKPLLIINQKQFEEFEAETVPGTETSKSGLYVPLFVGDEMKGMISLENVDCENAFNEEDMHLLMTIVSSMSVALENARLFAETQRLLKETDQRAKELAVINSIQQGLAAQLDMQAIYDLVGEKIFEIVDTQSVNIMEFDKKQQLTSYVYLVEKGKRFYPKPRSFTRYVEYLIKTNEAVLLNDHVQERFAEWGVATMPGTEPTRSYLGIPLSMGAEVKWAIAVYNTAHENAFSDSDLRLLKTLASSMGVALENARLFDETQRLLKETEERNAELAVINSIQQGLASELDFQAIVDLVGDKLRDVFLTPNLQINWVDEKNKLSHSLYFFYHGERVAIPPQPLLPGGPLEWFQKTRQAIVGNTLDVCAKFNPDSLPKMPGLEKSKSGVSVPIIHSDRILGAISLENYEQENAYGESEVRLLTTIAGSLGAALENARLFSETQRLLKETDQRAKELAVINSIQQGLAAQLDMQAIYDLVGDKIREVFDAQAVSIGTGDINKGIGTTRYFVEKGKRYYPEPRPFGNITKKLIQTRKPWLVLNQQQFEELGSVTIPGTEPPRSGLFVPLFVGEEMKGLISLQNVDRENAFTETDMHLLMTIASSMGVALENARLFDETQRLLKETEQRNAELAVINTVQASLASELNMQGIYDAVGDKICTIFKKSDVSIRIIDPRTGYLHFPYNTEFGKRIFIESHPISEGGFGGHVIRTRETLVINENMTQAMQQYESHILNAVDQDGVEALTPTDMEDSAVYVPLVSGDQVRGLIVLSTDHEQAYSDSDVRLLQTLANSMSVALENARLFDETQRLLKETDQRAAELATVNTLSQALASATELDALIDLTGEQMRQTFRADIVYVALLDPQSRLINFPYAYGEHMTSMHLGEGLTSKIIQTGQPLLINKDMTSQRATLGVALTGQEALSYLGVPIMAGRQAIGVISVQSIEQEGQFDEDDMRLLSTLAANVGVAIEKARLYDETLRREREAAAMAEVGREISATLDLPTVLERIAARALDLLKGDISAVYLPEEEGKTFRAIAAVGVDASHILQDTVKLGEGIIGDTARRAVAEMLQDAYADPRVKHIPGTPVPNMPERLMVAPLLAGEPV
jgi:GAF domain-containing protein